jgi:HlyD family secretion protein
MRDAAAALCLAAVFVVGVSSSGSARLQRAGSSPLRLHGVVEPISSYAVTAPRLAAGQGGPGNQLVVIRLVPSGTVVQEGDLLVEFDRHAQIKNAHDRRAEYNNFIAQIRKKKGEQRTARAQRESELLKAQNAVRLAELDLVGVELLPKIQAEKNQQALDEARAHLNALKKTLTLKDAVDRADLRILEIQRDRAENAWKNAEANATRMQIRSPLSGMVVLKSIWKQGTMAVVQEGEEVRSGIPIMDVVNTSAMRVRALVNQADVGRLRVGQMATVTLDSYPAKQFAARLAHLSPVASTSSLNQRVRSFVAHFTIDGNDPHLLPDLAAAVDLAPAATTGGTP